MRALVAFFACVLAFHFPVEGGLGSAIAGSPSPIVIVVAKDSPLANISRYDLKHLFLGEFVTGPDGKRLIPLNLSLESSDRRAFDAAVLGMSSEQGAAYWIDRRIRGQSGSPRAVDSADLAQRIVARLDGAVAYVRLSAVRPDVKVLHVDGKKPTDPAYGLP